MAWQLVSNMDVFVRPCVIVLAGRGMPNGERIQARYPGVMFSQFEGAEFVAKKFDIQREEMEQFAVRSHQRAAQATKNGYFKNEIIPIKGQNKEGQEVRCSPTSIRYSAD